MSEEMPKPLGKTMDEELKAFWDVDETLLAEIIAFYEPYRTIFDERLENYNKKEFGTVQNFRAKYLYLGLPNPPKDVMEKIDQSLEEGKK